MPPMIDYSAHSLSVHNDIYKSICHFHMHDPQSYACGISYALSAVGEQPRNEKTLFL